MSYQLEKENPYENKKCSFVKKIASTFMTFLTCGTVIIASSRLYQKYQMSVAEKEFETTISYYEDLITETAQFMKENANTLEECFEIYTELLWKGYFSNHQMYYHNVIDQNNIIGNYGAKIATGKGDCKNDSDFFYRIIKELGYEGYQVVCVQVDDTVKAEEYLFGNHVITVVKDQEKEYYFDATNACTYQKKGNVYVNDDRELTIVLKPIISYMYGYNSEIEIMELLLDSVSLDSGDSVVVDGSYIKDETKILSLRKSIKPLLEGICDSMNMEDTL